jgi:phage host-nuclease inhibitor protein Gam
MPKSKKSDHPAILSWEECDAFGLEWLKADREARQLKAELDTDVAALKADRAPAIKAAEVAANQLWEGIEAWVASHQTEMLGRSITLTHIRSGFRKSPMVEKLLATWDECVERVRGLGRKYAGFLRQSKPALDKEAVMKAWRAGELTKEQLGEIGLEIDPDREMFFIEGVEQPVASVH